MEMSIGWGNRKKKYAVVDCSKAAYYNKFVEKNTKWEGFL